MTDKPQIEDRTTNKDDDPVNPEFWHKVARMTVLDLVQALVEFLEERKNKQGR